MGESRLSAEDIRAAAEVHAELGPEYRDAVVESFLARIDQHIEARVEEQLARTTPRRRQVDPARLSKQRTVLAGAVTGALVAGVPLSLGGWYLLKDAAGNPAPLLLIWVVLLAVYGMVAYRLRRR